MSNRMKLALEILNIIEGKKIQLKFSWKDVNKLSKALQKCQIKARSAHHLCLKRKATK